MSIHCYLQIVDLKLFKRNQIQKYVVSSLFTQIHTLQFGGFYIFLFTFEQKEKLILMFHTRKWPES